MSEFSTLQKTLSIYLFIYSFMHQTTLDPITKRALWTFVFHGRNRFGGMVRK